MLPGRKELVWLQAMAQTQRWCCQVVKGLFGCRQSGEFQLQAVRVPLQRPERKGDAHEGPPPPSAVQEEGKPRAGGRREAIAAPAQAAGGEAAPPAAEGRVLALSTRGEVGVCMNSMSTVPRLVYSVTFLGPL